MNTAISVIFPALDESKIDMPDSMHPDDRAFLVRELGKISSKLAVRDERNKQLTDRVTKLEDAADASGEHKAIVLQAQLEKTEKDHAAALDKRDASTAVWKGRAWTFFATFFTTGILGLIAHYLTTR